VTGDVTGLELAEVCQQNYVSVMGCNTLPVQLTHPLVTVHILLLDLVVTLAKFLLVLVFSLEDTLIQAHLLSQQPSLRAFP